MFHWRPVRRLPRDIELEVETLIAELRGEARVPLPPTEEAVNEASRARSLSVHSLLRFLPHVGLIGLRRDSVDGSGANDR